MLIENIHRLASTAPNKDHDMRKQLSLVTAFQYAVAITMLMLAAPVVAQAPPRRRISSLMQLATRPRAKFLPLIQAPER
jgi:hypothetical protein